MSFSESFLQVTEVSANTTLRTNESGSYGIDVELAESKYPEYRVANEIWINGGILTIILGTIGHVLSIVVLLGSKRMRLLSLTVYLVANSCAGLAALYVGLLRQVILHQTRWQTDVRDLTDGFGCRLHTALTYMSLQLFSWLQASIAVERTIAVTRPLQYKRWCTWRRNLIWVSAVVAFLAACNSMVAVIYEEKPNSCKQPESPQMKRLFTGVWGYFDLVLYSLLPIAVIVPCNALTLNAIYGTKIGKQSSGRKYLQLTIMLLVQNCLCVATTLPVSIIFLMPWPDEELSAETAKREIDWTILSLLQYFGTTFSFAIYSASAKRFRQAALDLVCKGFNAKLTSVSGPMSSRKNVSNTKLVSGRLTTTTPATPSTDRKTCQTGCRPGCDAGDKMQPARTEIG